MACSPRPPPPARLIRQTILRAYGVSFTPKAAPGAGVRRGGEALLARSTMAAQILPFPSAAGSARRRRRSGRGRDLGPTLETALHVHHLVVHGLRLNRFSRHRQGTAAALLRDLHEVYGEEQVRVVIDTFTLVYGCDPFAFLEHLASCR